MSLFRDIAVSRIKPAAIRVFPPSVFVTGFEGAPDDDVAIGIRLISDYDVSLAKANAVKTAKEIVLDERSIDARLDAYNDALFRELACLCTTDPNDAATPWFKGGIDETQRMLTPEGARAIFDAYESVVVETSPVHGEITDDELIELLDRLPEIELLSDSRRSRVNRFLSLCLDELRCG